MLKSIFVSYHFDKLPRQFVNKLEDAFRYLEIKLTQGDQLAGGRLSDEINKLINESDGVFGILTERDPDKNREWVITELAAAQNQNKNILLFVQKGQTVPSNFKGNEYYTFETIDDADLWIKILATIYAWKRINGEDLIAKLLPENIVNQLRQINIDNLQVQYRQLSPQFEPGSWVGGRIARSEGGIQLYLPKIKQDHSVEIKITHGSTVWSSIDPKVKELIFELTETN